MNKNIIGCGYCNKELICEKRDGKTNLAKLGCKDYEHFTVKLTIKNDKL